MKGVHPSPVQGKLQKLDRVHWVGDADVFKSWNKLNECLSIFCLTLSKSHEIVWLELLDAISKPIQNKYCPLGILMNPKYFEITFAVGTRRYKKTALGMIDSVCRI